MNLVRMEPWRCSWRE